MLYYVTRPRQKGRNKVVVHYRLYFLNAVNHITHAVDVDCDTDDQALAAAQEQAHSGKIEIWQGQRKVGVCAAAKSAIPDDVD